jgi:hypothetical protein
MVLSPAQHMRGSHWTNALKKRSDMCSVGELQISLAQLEISLEGLEIWKAVREGSAGAQNGEWQCLDTETGAFAGR